MIFPEAMTELSMYRRFKDAVKVPILANITEFGHTPLYTRDELSTVGVDIVLHCCSAYRAMNAAALAVYEAIRRDGTQKNVIDRMQTRADLYKYLDYYAYEAKLDALFAEGKGHDGGNEHDGFSSGRFQTQEVGGLIRRNGRQYGAVHGGQDGQRSALPGLRHPRYRDSMRVRGDRPFVGAREITEPVRTGRVQDEAQIAARAAPRRPHGVGTAAGDQSSHGCSAHRSLGAGVSAAGSSEHPMAGARDIADRLLASLGSMLCYWHHYATAKRRIDVQTGDDSIGAHFLHLLHGREPPASWVRAMHTSLNLYAEHEFNASTFTARVIAGTGSDLYSCIAGAIGALRGPKHGGANEVAFEIQARYATADAPKPTSGVGSRTKRSSSASATRFTPYPTRAMRSSRKWHGAWRAEPTTCADSWWPSASSP